MSHLFGIITSCIACITLLPLTCQADFLRPAERRDEEFKAKEKDSLTPTKVPSAYYEKPLPAPEKNYPQKPTANDTQAVLTLIENQMNAIQSNNIAAAYDTYTTIAFRNNTSLEEFKYFISSYPVFIKNRNSYFGGIKFQEDNAIINGTLTATDGTTAIVEYYLNKENGLWKILGIEVKRPSVTSAKEDFLPKPEKHYDFQNDIEHKIN